MKIKNAIAASLMSLMLGNVHAIVIDVQFAGMMHDGYGLADGLDLSTLWGSEIHGSFSFDTSNLTLNAGMSTPYRSQWMSATPISVSETVEGHTFTFFGSQYSYLTVVTNQDGMNGFQIASLGENPVFTTPIWGNSSDGPRYISDLSNPETIAFSVTDIVGFNSSSSIAPGAGYYFEVNSASAAPIAAPIPEPETYAMMLAGLGLLGLTARRRKQKLDA